MALLGLDTRGWNLSAGLITAAMAGCGPTVVLSDTDGIDDPTEGTDGGTDVDDVAEGPMTTTTPMPQCMTNADCPSGFFCDDGVCEEDYGYEDNCNDGGCCDGGYCCYDDGGYCYEEGPYGDCYSDDDCRSGALCNNRYGYGYCESLEQLDDCGESQAPELLPLPFDVPGASEIVSMRFVETDGVAGDELAILRADGAEVVRSGQAAVALPAPNGTIVSDVADGDFNGDGVRDLAATLSPSGVGVFLGDGAGGFTIVEANIYATGATGQLRALDYDGDGALDVAATDPAGGSVLLFGVGDGTFGSSSSHADSDVRNLVATEVMGPGFDDVAVSANGGVTVFIGNAGGADNDQPLLPDGDHAAPLMLAADPGGNGLNAVVSFTPINGWVAIRAFYQGTVYERARLDSFGSSGDTGDIGGDGGEDFLILDGATLTYFAGSTDGAVGCGHSYPLDAEYDQIAVGDLDGDGRAEVAVSAGAAVALYGTL